MVSLTDKNIIWYPQILHRDDMIMSCGNFPNVPLIGSMGCINHNTALAMSQLGYHLAYNPDDKFLEGFILQNTTIEYPTLLKVIHTWKNINQGRSNLIRPRDESAIPYTEWIKERVRKVKLPFALERPVMIRPPEPVMISMEEVAASTQPSFNS